MMSETQDNDPDCMAEVEGNRRPYEPPRIVWREPYEPIACAVSCALLPSDTSCAPAAFS